MYATNNRIVVDSVGGTGAVLAWEQEMWYSCFFDQQYTYVDLIVGAMPLR